MEYDPLYGPIVSEKGWFPAPRYLLRRDRVLRLLKGFVPGKLLEIGCGAGTLIHEIHRLGFECEGLESSPNALEIARYINDKTIPLHQSPDLGWQDTFDYLFNFEVLEHIEDDSAALNTWLSWLKPGGMMLMSVPAKMNRWTATDTWAGHYRRYERDDLNCLLKSVGFTVEHFESYGYPLANLIAPIRAKTHARHLADRERDHETDMQSNTALSGVERKTEAKLFPLMDSFPGRVIMRSSFWLQGKFTEYDVGDGYIVIARKPGISSKR